MGFNHWWLETRIRISGRRVLDLGAPVQAYHLNNQNKPLVPEDFEFSQVKAILTWYKQVMDVEYVKGDFMLMAQPLYRIPLLSPTTLTYLDKDDLKDLNVHQFGVEVYFWACLIDSFPGLWRFELKGYATPEGAPEPIHVQTIHSNPFYLQGNFDRCAA
jgi:hypothetical protein